jgi:hypothetical protein
MNTINETYINALLADASYVRLQTIPDGGDEKSPPTGILRTAAQINAALAARLTQPQADFITANFTVLNQVLSPTGGFDAVVWQGKAGTAYAGKNYVSMRGTQGLTDIADDIGLAAKGIPYDQVVSMVNWWLKNTAAAGVAARQIKASTTISGTSFERDIPTLGTGVLEGIDTITSINGHSLGGYLCTAFVRLFGKAWDMQSINTFNSAGFSNAAYLNIISEYNNISTMLTGNMGMPFAQIDTIQNNYLAGNGLSVTTNNLAGMWLPGFMQYGTRQEIYQEQSTVHENHYLYKQTDLLALGAAIERLDPTFNLDKLNALSRAGSNGMKASYEGVLDALRKALLGTSFTGNTLIGDVSNGNETQPESRQHFHQNLKELLNSNAYKALLPTGYDPLAAVPNGAAKLSIRAVAGDTALASKAANNFSDFIALYTLSPLVIEGANAAQQAALDAQLKSHNTDLYQDWQRDATLRQQGKAPDAFTDKYLNDRQSMLQWLQVANINDLPTLSDGIIYIGGAYSNGITKNTLYIDQVSGKKIHVGATMFVDLNKSQRIVFGDNNNDAIAGGDDLSQQGDDLYGGANNDYITGNEGNDYIEGNAGSDVLTGNNGNDTLIGGTGFDTYAFGSAALIKATPAGSAATNFGNDTIKDTDGQGRILIDGLEIKGGSHVTPLLNRLYPEIAIPKSWADTYYTDNQTVMMQIMKDKDPASTTGQSLWIARVTNRAEIYLGGTILKGFITVKDFDVTKAKTGSYLGIHLGDEIRPIVSCSFGKAKALIYFGLPQAVNVTRSDPLMLDLNGDGIINHTALDTSNTFFDLAVNGIRSQTGWVDAQNGKGDGILVLDGGLNGRSGEQVNGQVNGQSNGTIDNASELFGDRFIKANGQLAKDGFDALASLDSNADGYVDAQDSAFARLKVWVDANSDGISQDSELRSLANAYVDVDTAGNPTGVSSSVGITRFNVTPANDASYNLLA